ncbi:lactate/malate family dehydrogenase [Cyanobium sp. Morenito 9A2]|uniref:lactate/malate family dehydrogenase n=1 Tax=Cyanobium sp. Morenito 9A2 TaxID=2823718 RepID=UPI0020CE97E7|nr:hypothetical protein [Cyanobium sp. Morenito 9A2]MCP9849224.1 hypothetical protein [Cyanobium sp. Morenito 9A2]
MDVAIVGAAGSCGRQLASQLLDRRLLPATGRLQLVGHQGGRSADELWGLRADLDDAFVDGAPALEVVVDPADLSADLVVMLAGVTVSSDLGAAVDRAALGKANLPIYQLYAEAMAARNGPPPTVIVQSNPVELGVQVFAERLGRRHVIGAGALSDSLRVRAELAVDLGVRRPQVQALMLGQHGDHALPLWSQLRVQGVATEAVAALVHRIRAGRTLADFPQELRAHRMEMFGLIRSGQVQKAYDLVETLSADLRAVVKPFFIHFTAGRTTEIATAHAVAEIIAAMVTGEQRILPAQVLLAGEWLDLHGVVAAPVILSAGGWEAVEQLELEADELAGLHAAMAAISTANRAVMQPS